MLIARLENRGTALAILRPQLIYPPLRIAVEAFRILCGLFQQGRLVAQKIAQNRVRQTAHFHVQHLCGAHCMIDHGMLRGFAVLQLVQRHQQHVVDTLIQHRLVQQQA